MGFFNCTRNPNEAPHRSLIKPGQSRSRISFTNDRKDRSPVPQVYRASDPLLFQTAGGPCTASAWDGPSITHITASLLDLLGIASVSTQISCKISDF